jgi:hypothetical protein
MTYNISNRRHIVKNLQKPNLSTKNKTSNPPNAKINSQMLQMLNIYPQTKSQIHQMTTIYIYQMANVKNPQVSNAKI